ncbi:DUF4955 domain-containing protein [Bacteroides pyogenes]|nr:DUF4955 domain-containing protein [Bacteroides pyogenes]MBR8706068.1 hypothetical protein [Bacteroides pyogenes]MBR8707844.1 hypothetical protein [Bacteroides pyogenes]MBR8716473.1 hypothetical protein [Bacteroides pyogenes]MBR8746217.1 hypothetical protein [Bacteroides pyogenes]MBR8756547.1 hypothetical protein [Bacteroides pyogenes]
MKSKSITYLLLWSICSLFVFMQSCQETDDLKTDINRLKDRVAALEKATEGMNTSFASLQALIQANKTIIGVTPTKDGKGYSVELSDGTTVRVMNSESVAASVPVFSVDDEGYWMYKTASETDFRYLPGPDGEEKISAIPRTEAGTPILTPQLNVSSTGYWQVSYDGGTTFTTLKDADGQDIKAEGGKQGGTTVFSKVVYDEEKKTLSFTLAGTDPEQSYTFPVDDSFGLVIEGWNPDKIEEFAESEPFKEYNVRQTDIKEAMIQPLPGWNVRLTEEKLIVTPLPDVTKNKEETIKIVLTSSKNYIRIVSMSVKVLPSGVETPAWKQFKEKSDENVLLDFSYAGYMHGESAPAEMDEWIAKGYKVYDVTKYGAIPNDGQPDREAFMKVLAEIAGKPENIKKEDNGMTDRYIRPSAKAVIYFPEGNYILQNEASKDRRIRISMGDIVLKGAGRNKTTLEMTVANNSPEPVTQMWNAPVMMEFKHNTGLGEPIANITEDAPVGSKTVAATALGIKSGDWVCLVLVNNNETVINQALSPYKWQDIKVLPGAGELNIKSKGVQVYEYHQVEKADAGKITFKEPIMHAINKDWGWKLHKFANYSNVGVEDLTFKGHAKEKFIHHGSDVDDGGFKLIDFVRLTHSWIRRVNFESVSEAMSITSSANCSAYDIQIGGNRGHSSIRSQASSRVFIGKVVENSDGYTLRKGQGESTLIEYKNNVGQYHACGVSKQSMGAVIWNVKWGDDSCFESHATQPRATLIDCCSGGFMHWRQGGDSAQMPNHLENLTIWNFNATNVQTDPDIDKDGKFTWWDSDGYWWKFVRPIVVGFHGSPLSFDDTQMKRNESPGKAVHPYSLYEAQLRLRLGYVPAWLNALK